MSNVTMNQIEQRRVAIISTAHLTESDAKLLESGVEPAGLCFKGEYGWHFNGFIEWEDWRKKGLSEAAYYTLQELFQDGFDRVEFDQDAEQVEGLPVFDWQPA